MHSCISDCSGTYNPASEVCHSRMHEAERLVLSLSIAVTLLIYLNQNILSLSVSPFTPFPLSGAISLTISRSLHLSLSLVVPLLSISHCLALDVCG